MIMTALVSASLSFLWSFGWSGMAALAFVSLTDTPHHCVFLVSGSEIGMAGWEQATV